MLSLIAEILTILAPAAILASIGVAWTKVGPEFPVKFVSTLVVNIGMPALLFHTLATSTIDLNSLGAIVLATLCVHFVFTLIALTLLKVARKDWRLCVAYVCGNTGNLGLPVCYFAYGDAGLAYAMAFFAVQCLLLFSVGEAVLSASGSLKPALRSPILHAVWLGTVARYFDWSLPQFLMDTTSLLGQLVIPIMLITLGVSLANMSIKSLPSTIRWSMIRTGVALCVGFFVASLFNLEGVARGVLIIETAVPVAVFNFLLALRHNRDSVEISGLIVVTHLSAIVYLPLLLGVLLIK